MGIFLFRYGWLWRYFKTTHQFRSHPAGSGGLRQQYQAGEAAQQAVLTQSIADAMLTHELAALEIRYHGREALRDEMDRRSKQDNARFQAQLGAMEQRIAQMAEQRQAEAARQARPWELTLERMCLDLDQDRAAMERARGGHEQAVERERADWEHHQAAHRRDLEFKHLELAQRLADHDREHARRLKELDNDHAKAMMQLRMEHLRSLPGSGRDTQRNRCRTLQGGNTH